ncbi:MAG: hypothetical protein ACRYHA_08395 [Janthinobacterium lividum]
MRPAQTLYQRSRALLCARFTRLAPAAVACATLAGCIAAPYGGYGDDSGTVAQPAYIETGPAYYAPAPYYGPAQGGAVYYYDEGPRWRGPPPPYRDGGPRFPGRAERQDGPGFGDSGQGRPRPNAPRQAGPTPQGGPAARPGPSPGPPPASARPGNGGVRSGGGEGRWNGGGAPGGGRGTPPGGSRVGGEGG